jgi:L-rhamnose mutarotase
MKRFGMVIRIKPEYLEEYVSFHKCPDPELLASLEKSNIKNNTVFHVKDVLFNYFEYYGTNFEADWKIYTESKIVKELFVRMKGFFLPMEENFPEKGWTEMKEVFRKD